MSFYHQLMSLALIGLLVPAGTAWAGASPDAGGALCRNQEPLMHICRGGAHVGQQCPVTCEGAGNEPNPCPEECVVKYVHGSSLTLTIPATVTFSEINQTTDKVTIFLEVKKDSDGIPHLFEIPAQKYLDFNNYKLESLVNGLLFRQAPEQLATSLRELFKIELCLGLYGESPCQLPKNLIPVIARIKEPIYRRFPGAFGDFTPTVLGVPIDIGFAFLRQTAASIPGDLNCDDIVDKFDLKTLVLDLNKNVSESICRTTPCSTTCDLDGDGRITALDSRKLTLLCTRPQCATQ